MYNISINENYKLDNVKFSSGKILFKSSRCVMLLHGPSWFRFNRTELLTTKIEKDFLLVHCFGFFVAYVPKSHVTGTQIIVYEYALTFRKI